LERNAHWYYFRAMALDDMIEDEDGEEFVTFDDILDVMEDINAKVKLLAFGMLMVMYKT